MYVIAESLEDAKQKINDDLNCLYVKLCQNKLKLNVKKTMIFQTIVKVKRLTNKIFLLITLNIMSMNQIIKFRTIIFIFKIVNGFTAQYLKNKIHYNNENNQLSLRNSNDIISSNSTKSCSQNSLLYKAIQLFNSLPPNIKSEKTFEKSKKLYYMNIPLKRFDKKKLSKLSRYYGKIIIHIIWAHRLNSILNT